MVDYSILKYNKIIFVCTGNTCRSPMAEALAKGKLKKRDTEVAVISRGLSIYQSTPANEKAIETMKSYGHNLDNHKSKEFSTDDIEDNIIILTMTQRHCYSLVYKFPELRGKIFPLKEYLGEYGDILDPYGASISVYRETAQELDRLIEILINNL